MNRFSERFQALALGSSIGNVICLFMHMDITLGTVVCMVLLIVAFASGTKESK